MSLTSQRLAEISLHLLHNNYKNEAQQILEASSTRFPVYSSLVYFSRTKHRGLNPECDEVQDIIEEAKKGNKAAIRSATKTLSQHPGLHGFHGWLAPAPRSKRNKPSNHLLADSLLHYGIGTNVVDMVQRIKDVQSSRMRRREKGVEGGTTLDEHLISMGFVGEISDQGIILVDDIFTTGATLKAMALTMRKAGYKGPIAGATLGYYQADIRKLSTCPVHHKVFYI